MTEKSVWTCNSVNEFKQNGAFCSLAHLNVHPEAAASFPLQVL